MYLYMFVPLYVCTVCRHGMYLCMYARYVFVYVCNMYSCWHLMYELYEYRLANISILLTGCITDPALGPHRIFFFYPEISKPDQPNNRDVALFITVYDGVYTYSYSVQHFY